MTPPGRRRDLRTRGRLPAGRHGLPGDVVREHQSQRLITAMAKCCASRGYGEVSVDEIVRTASVSKRTFYEIFDGKEACLLASYADYRERLLAAIGEACLVDEPWPRRARRAIRATLSFLASDPAAAELLTTSILGTGSEGSRSYYETVDLFADLLREHSPAPASHPRGAWATIAAIGAVIGQAANSRQPTHLLELEDDLSLMLLALGGGSQPGS